MSGFRNKILRKFQQTPGVWTLSEIRRKNDYPEILLELGDGPTMQRTLPTSHRASVRVGESQCAFPQFWYMGGTTKEFGCAYCPEQDICPLHNKHYRKQILQIRKVTGTDNERVAAKYHGIKLKLLESAPVEETKPKKKSLRERFGKK